MRCPRRWGFLWRVHNWDFHPVRFWVKPKLRTVHGIHVSEPGRWQWARLRFWFFCRDCGEFVCEDRI